MARTYKKTYLNGAMRNLAVMMDCGDMQGKGLGINEVVAMYYPLHEADLSRFAAAANGIIERNIQ